MTSLFIELKIAENDEGVVWCGTAGVELLIALKIDEGEAAGTIRIQ